jgi:hypothetical protein
MVGFFGSFSVFGFFRVLNARSTSMLGEVVIAGLKARGPLRL